MSSPTILKPLSFLDLFSADQQLPSPPPSSYGNRPNNFDTAPHPSEPSSYSQSSAPRFFNPAYKRPITPLPIEIITIITKHLRRDGASYTISSLQSLCRQSYLVVSPILYGRIRITDSSWVKLFGLLEGVPRPKVDTPIEVIAQELGKWPHPVDAPQYVRLRWFFGQITHLELVALGSLQFSKAASAIGKSLSDAHSQFLLSGLQTIHVTEEYNAWSCFGPLDDDGYPCCRFTPQEAVLAPLCAPHKLCICIPKEDRWGAPVHLFGISEAHNRTSIEQALRKGVQAMLGNRNPQQTVNATAITYHNARMRYVVPPQSGQVSCEYILSFIHPRTSLSDGQGLDRTTLTQRAQQIAEFIMVVYGPDRPFPSPGSIVILRPQSMFTGRGFKELESRVRRVVDEASAKWPEQARSTILDSLNEVHWLAKSERTELGDCNACGEPY